MSVQPIQEPPVKVTEPAPQDIDHEIPFWLVTTVEIQSIDYTTEITELLVYTKWQFKNEAFFDPDTLRELVCHCGDIEESDYDDLLNGKRLAGFMVDPVAGSKYFPVNPNSVIQNDCGKSQNTCGPNWLKLDPNTRNVYCQLVFTVTIHTPFQMKEFPFDRHLIPLCLATRSWKEKDDENIKHCYKWVLLRKKPDWSEESDFPEDNTIISENVAWIDSNNEMVHLKPMVHETKKRKPILCLKMERDPSYFVYTTCLPICCIVLLCLASFFLEFNNSGARLEAVLIAALAVSAYKSVIEGKLPVKSYLTYADYYLLMCFVFFFLLVLKIVMAFQGLGNGVGFFWYEEEVESDEDDFKFEDSKTNVLFQNLDDASSWALILIWSTGHALVLLDAYIRHRGVKVKVEGKAKKVKGEARTGILDRFVRPSWDKKAAFIQKQKSIDLILGTN
jgi:hypothetical protein